MAGMTPIGKIPLSPIQQAHASTISRASGFTTTLEGELNEQAIKNLIIGLSQHQLLHSINMRKNSCIGIHVICR